MDHTDVFTTKAFLYEKSRPSYPDEMLTFLKHQFNIKEDTLIADIGAGTGKFTEKILDLGCRVIAVEPNQVMAERLRDSLMCDQLVVSERPAEHTEIDAGTVDLVVAAQAFHWFDWQQFKEECSRILKPRGVVCLIWNVRDEEALINRRTADIFKTYCPAYKGSSNGMMNHDGAIRQFFEGEFELFETRQDLTYKEQQFIDRCLSASYALEATDEDFDAFVTALRSLFQAFAEEGKVLIPNMTRCYYGTI